MREPAMTSTERPFTGRHMLLVMLAFFGVIIAVNVVLAVLAADSWTGLVVKNSYVASQDFSETAAEARRQDALGWSPRLDYRPGRLRLVLDGPRGEPLRGVAVTARIGRPVHENDDRLVALPEREAGIYETPLELAPGLWQVETLAENGNGDQLRRIFRITVTDEARQ